MAYDHLGVQAQICLHGHYTCQEHPSQQLLFYCHNCDGDLICLECVTSTHQGHTFEKICNVTTEKRKKLEEFVRTAEETEIPNIRLDIKSVHNQIQDNSKYIQTLTDEIKSEGEKLKKEIDKITKKLVNTCKTIEQNNFDLLSQYELQLQSAQSQLNDRVNKYQKAIESVNNITVIEVEKDIHRRRPKPRQPKLQTVKFTAAQCTTTWLQGGIGWLNIPSSNEKFLNPDFQLVSEFQHTCNLTSVKKSTSDSVWVSCCNDKYISLINLEGSVKKKVNLGSYMFVRDISVSPVTGNLWFCCCRDESVYEVSGTIPSKRFQTDHWLWAICTTSANTVVVYGNHSNIKVYSTTGQVMQALIYSEICQVETPRPEHITVCPSTGNIAICNSTGLAEDIKPHVAVFDPKLNLKYQIYGPNNPSYRKTMKSDFYPTDAVFDSHGNLLVADYYNKLIQLVNSDGQFQAPVFVDISQPIALTLIENGLLCVAFEDKTVKVIQYRW